MVHVEALPGTPKHSKNIEEIIAQVIADAQLLEEGGVDAIMIENMHDRPYLNKKVGPEIVASMAVIAGLLREKIKLPLGIQILAGANKEALSVALAAGFNFIRAEGFVFGHIADEGLINSDAGELLRFRKKIGAEHILIFTDIKKKHSSHALTNDVSIGETAKAAAFFLSDGIIVTGSSTGQKAAVDEVRAVKNSTRVPVIIGSGIDQYNIHEFWEFADGFIVGSSFKKDGLWEKSVELERVNQFMNKINQLRKI